MGSAGAIGSIAPQYVIVEAHTGYAGDSGDLAELQPGARGNTGKLDSSQLVVDDDGRFEILLAPERPEGAYGQLHCHTADLTPHRHGVSR